MWDIPESGGNIWPWVSVLCLHHCVGLGKPLPYPGASVSPSLWKRSLGSNFSSLDPQRYLEVDTECKSCFHISKHHLHLPVTRPHRLIKMSSSFISEWNNTNSGGSFGSHTWFRNSYWQQVISHDILDVILLPTYVWFKEWGERINHFTPAGLLSTSTKGKGGWRKSVGIHCCCWKGTPPTPLMNSQILFPALNSTIPTFVFIWESVFIP